MKKVDVKTEDGTVDCYTFEAPGNPSAPGVIFFMDAFGVRPELFAMAERLAQQGYFVLLPNLLYRSGDFPPFDPATAFKEESERNRLMALVRSISNGMVMQDTAAFVEFLGKRSSEKIGCVGYCMGGRFAFLAAGTYPDRIAAAASFHASNLATEQPDSPHLLAGKIEAQVYIGVAGLDANFKPEEKARLLSALEAAGVRHTFEVYPEVRHGFAVNGGPVYDHEAAERHWERLLQLFEDHLSNQIKA